MRYWFSNYEGRDWTPACQYNQLFAEQVHYIRDQFHLSKQGPGMDIGTGFWQEYQLQRRTVYVQVEKFEWGKYYKNSNNTQVQFYLYLRVATDPAGKNLIFKEVLIIDFLPDYPACPPLFTVNTSQHMQVGASHEHHMLGQGRLCILGAPRDWNSRKDTILSALNAALDWVVWHYYKHGW